MQKIISLFVLISITFSLICCSLKKNKGDQKKYPTLYFDVMYVGINELKIHHSNIIFQLKNMKEGNRNDHSIRHEYVLTGGYFTGNTFNEIKDLMKNDSLLSHQIPIAAIPDEDQNGGLDLKIGNYPYLYNVNSFPAAAAYMILTPSKYYHDANHGDPNYIMYTISYCNSTFDTVPAPVGIKDDPLYLDPSPPAIPPF